MQENIQMLPEKAELQRIYDSYSSLLNSVLQKIEQKLKNNIHLASMPTYKSRIKSFPSYYKKVLRQKPQEATQNNHLVTLTDMMGIRVICAFLEDLDEVQSQITTLFKIKEIEKHGADQTFKEFGYESIHILVEIPQDCFPESYGANGITLPDETVCEIQIRTILQDAWAEVEHELVYKSEFNPFDKPLRRKLASMNASLTLADIIFQEIRDYQKKLQGELECRRNTFYEKADDITAEELGIKSETNQNNALQFDTANKEHATIDDLVLEALHAHNTGKLDKAVEIYTKIVESKPEPNSTVLSVILKHRGMAYFAENKYEEALADFKKSAEFDQKAFRSLYYEGIVYSVMNKDKDAVACFDKSLEIDSFQSHVYYRRALAYFNLGEYKQSLADLDNAAKLGLVDDDCKLLRAKLVSKFDMGM